MAQLIVSGKSPDRVSVRDYGAVGDGVTDDTAAFGAAIAAATAVNNISGAKGQNIPRALMCNIYVPPGTYLLTEEVDTGNREVIYELDQGALVTNFTYLNGEVLRAGQRQVDYHHGTLDYACTMSLKANAELDEGAGVLGWTNQSDIVNYGDRDSVTLYVDNTAPPLFVSKGASTYTSTTVTSTALLARSLKQLRKGMIIDTKHSPKWSGFIDSWNEDGSVITVGGWYENGGSTTPGTPADGTGFYINRITKAWAQNTNIALSSTSDADRAVGMEIGVINNKGVLDFTNQINYIWGYDAISTGTYNGAVAYIARGDGTSKFHRGFDCADVAQASFHCAGNPTYGFWSEQSSGTPFEYSPGGSVLFRVDVNGNILGKALTLNSSSAAMELGSTSASNTPFIDFHSSGNAIDYDARILASGGTASSGNGALTVTANGGFITSGPVRGSTDNSKTCGTSSFRWSNTYSTQFRPGDGTPIWTSGSGSPESVVTAVVGSLYTRTDGGASTTLYVKESGSGNTGWVAK